MIHIFANGGPSQIDTFDPKPMLRTMEGKTFGDDLHPIVDWGDGSRLHSSSSSTDNREWKSASCFPNSPRAR
ncbi:MAG: DUF1501 domain-containing protein [Pirellulaceae bacterium]